MAELAEALHILLLEDSSQDAEIIYELLKETVHEIKMDCTASKSEFISFLRTRKYDIILSDFKLSGFDGFSALKSAIEICPEVPFICVSGSIGENMAVELLKNGAVDYVLKDRLERLPSAVARALEEAKDKKVRKAGEEKLARQNAILNALINSPKDMIIFSLDTNYCYTAFNEKHRVEMKKIWNADIRLGESLLNYMSDKGIRDLAKKSIDRSKLGESFSEVQYQPDFNIYYEFSWEPVIQSDQVSGVAVFVRDITEQMQLEKSLSEKEELYRTLYENSTVGIYRTTPDGRILLANPTLVNLLGYKTFEELSNRNLEESGFEPSYERTNFIETIERDCVIRGLESSWTRSDGVRLVVSESARVIRNPEGKTLYYDGIVEDITLRKEAEELRNESENRYHSLFDNMLNGFAYCKMIYDGDYPIDFVYLDVNKAFEKLTGLKDVIGKRVSEIIPGIRETDNEIFEIYSRVALTGDPEIFENYLEPLKMWFSISVYSQQREFFTATFEIITERKLAEEQIRSLAKFPSENPGPILRVDKKGKLLYANDASHELLSWDLVIGTNVRSNLWKSISAALKKKDEKAFVSEHFQKVILFTVVPVAEEGYINLYGKDITEIQKTEEALRQSEDKFKYVFDHSVIGKSITLPTGEIQVNKSFCEMLGYSKEELVKTKWQEITHPDDIEATEEAVSSIISGEREFARFIKRYLHKNGSVVWTDIGTSLRRSEDGKPIYFMSSIVDISEQKRAEEALRENKVFLDTALANMTDAVFISNSAGEFIMFNDAFATFHRFSSKDECFKMFEEYPDILDVFFMSGEPAPIDMWAVPRALRGEIVTNNEYKLRRKDTGETWIGSYSFSPIRDPDGEIIGSVVVGRDVTEQKMREQEILELNMTLEKRVEERTSQLESANKELEAFSYSVSHDLRAPLRAVHGYTNILLDEYAEILNDEGKRLCMVISSNATKMGELIDDLLNFSRIGRSNLYSTSLDMKSMVVSVFSELLTGRDQKKIELKIDNLCRINGDPNLINLVWVNLISNAIKYSSKEPYPLIIIGSDLDKDMATYFVKDNGVGFDMQYVHKLFGVFQRLHSDNEFEGNGVGLAIVQRIILKHGGRVWAEAEAGKGATFYFSLPVSSNGNKNRLKDNLKGK